MVSLRRGLCSQSLLKRRFRPIQANVRSTTQRRGRRWKPTAPANDTRVFVEA
jgi:hypothetical protein